jgi:type II secretory pathway component PulF
VKTFQYVAADAAGKLLTGSASAASELALDRELEQKGLTLTRAKAVSAGRRGISARIRRDELIQLTTQLATITSAGVPIIDGLSGIGRRMQSTRSRELVKTLVEGLESGASLSQVMQPHARAFPDVYRASIRAGEASGALDQVLRRLASHLEWSRAMRATTMQALTYPAILLVAICGLIVVLLTFLLPRVLGLFPGGAEDLPAQTRLVVGVSDFVRSNGLLLLVGAMAAVAGWAAALRRPRSREALHRALLSVPQVGRVASQLATSKFASTASTLQSAGCDVFSVLEISASTCGNAALSAAFGRATERVRQGERISEAIEKEPLIDPLLVQLVEVGEKSGELDRCLETLVAHYDDEVPRSVKRMLTLLEPALLVGAGVVVAYILLAALLPVFQIYESIG